MNDQHAQDMARAELAAARSQELLDAHASHPRVQDKRRMADRPGRPRAGGQRRCPPVSPGYRASAGHRITQLPSPAGAPQGRDGGPGDGGWTASPQRTSRPPGTART